MAHTTNYIVYLGTALEFITEETGEDRIFWTLKVGRCNLAERVTKRWEELSIAGIGYVTDVKESEVLEFVRRRNPQTKLQRGRSGQSEFTGYFNSRAEAESEALRVIAHYTKSGSSYFICETLHKDSKIPEELEGIRVSKVYLKAYAQSMHQYQDFFRSKSKILKTVAKHENLKDASFELGITPKELEDYLSGLKIPHMFGETWQSVIQRYIKTETIAIDSFEYPEEWRNLEFLRTVRDGLVTKQFHLNGLADTILIAYRKQGEDNFSCHRDVLYKLGRFLQVNGYSPKTGSKIPKPDWIESKGRI